MDKGYINALMREEETEAERISRDIVASKCATVWRDANGRSRGDRFTMPVVRDTSESVRRTKLNGECVTVRGGGFYGGWKRSGGDVQ